MSLINYDYFTSGNKVIENVDTTEPEKKKRTRKSSSNPITDIVVANPEPELPLCQTNRPYQDTYRDTSAMLSQAIVQVDSMTADVMEQLQAIKNNKTLKSKYGIFNGLVENGAALINTKISAIREINSSISKSHDFEMKRAKDIMKIDSADKADSDKVTMDMYKAFISAPPTLNGTQYAPPTSSLISAGSTYQSFALPPAGVTAADNYDAGFSQYINNMSPETNMMILESNPNIKTVVRYDPATGKRMFDVVDMQTGQSVPNTPKPSPMFLEDAVLDTKNGIAKNNNLNTAYPIVITPGL